MSAIDIWALPRDEATKVLRAEHLIEVAVDAMREVDDGSGWRHAAEQVDRWQFLSPSFRAADHLAEIEEHIAWLRSIPYAEYLRTDHWRSLRQDALHRADYRCQACYSPDSLHVHHRTYERRGEEHIRDLTVLCADCHKLIHDHRKVG